MAQMIDRQKFFAGVRAGFGSLTQDQVDGLTALLDAIEADSEMTDVRWVAYALATVRHETANTYRPITEYGKGHGKPYGKKDAETGQIYYGRGFVQLTWKANYEKLGDLLGVDLVNHPELALETDTAYEILSLGMRNGLFARGQTLGRYIHDDACDYLHARKIINGMDKAELIAGYAATFETILNSSEQDAPEPAPVATSSLLDQATDGAKKLASNDQVKQIASEGFTKLATKAAGSMATGSTAAATAGTATHSVWLYVLAVIFALGVLGAIAYVLWHKHAKEALAAKINADKTLNDVEFVK